MKTSFKMLSFLLINILWTLTKASKRLPGSKRPDSPIPWPQPLKEKELKKSVNKALIKSFELKLVEPYKPQGPFHKQTFQDDADFDKNGGMFTDGLDGWKRVAYKGIPGSWSLQPKSALLFMIVTREVDERFYVLEARDDPKTATGHTLTIFNKATVHSSALLTFTSRNPTLKAGDLGPFIEDEIKQENPVKRTFCSQTASMTCRRR